MKELVPTTEEHIDILSKTMRQFDVNEVWAASGLLPKEALERCVKATQRPITGLIDGKVACLYGLVVPSLLSDVGHPWLLTSNVVDEHPLQFLRGCRQWMREYTAGVDRLVNYVDERHKQAQFWLKWLGFTLDDPAPYGPFNYPFRKFELVRN